MKFIIGFYKYKSQYRETCQVALWAVSSLGHVTDLTQRETIILHVAAGLDNVLRVYIDENN